MFTFSQESHAPVEVTELCEKLEEDLVVEKEIRVTKAQKRRDKKSNQERERENMIIEQEKANLHGARHTETEKIKKLLAAKTLTFYEVPSDGNWLATINLSLHVKFLQTVIVNNMIFLRINFFRSIFKFRKVII